MAPARCPILESWYAIIYEIFVVKRITSSMRLQEHKFDDILKIFLSP